MRVLILGGDGYLGWPTAMHFSERGDEVAVVDNFVKRRWEMELGIEPLSPIAPISSRIAKWAQCSGKRIKLFAGDICDAAFIYSVLDEFKPESIIHYGEQPSAPFSMMGRKAAVESQMNNVVGTLNLMFGIEKFCPGCHVVKLGTMGEYGTPNIDIEEGWLDVCHNGRSDRVLFPKKPQSFYHLSKVHDSHNLEFACRIWGARVTDLNQGVVYGLGTELSGFSGHLGTSVHYDSIFGTVLNRFMVQAVAGHPLTIYGDGSQTRGYLNIKDTIRCVEIACDNPAQEGEFRVFNQFTEIFSVRDLAKLVVDAGIELGINAVISNIENPRVEAENHYYNAKHTKLLDLGLNPTLLDKALLVDMLKSVISVKSNINQELFLPTIKWKLRS